MFHVDPVRAGDDDGKHPNDTDDGDTGGDLHTGVEGVDDHKIPGKEFRQNGEEDHLKSNFLHSRIYKCRLI